MTTKCIIVELFISNSHPNSNKLQLNASL